jgi:3-deoxy-D-manno-octulosonic-acid transferase
MKDLTVRLRQIFGAAGPETAFAPNADTLPATRNLLPLIWLDAPDTATALAMGGLIQPLLATREDLGILLTTPANLSDTALADQMRCVDPPGETPAQIRAFLEHWRPDVAVFSARHLPQGLVAAAQARGVATFLVVPPDLGGMPTGLHAWLRPTFRKLISKFQRIFLEDPSTAPDLRKAGATAQQIMPAGPLEPTLPPLACTEPERDAMAALLRNRPVWLAVALPPEEENLVLEALQRARELSHRMLLIIVPTAPARGPTLADEIAQRFGMQVSLRSRDEDPDSEDQVYIADTEAELGLWYRLATLAYLGGTSSGATPARHPYEAAGLGAVVLHGPYLADWPTAHGQLRRAGAARMVRDATELAEAVSDLMAPDRAAQMAFAGWQVSTNGSEVATQIAQTLLDALPTPHGKTA